MTNIRHRIFVGFGSSVPIDGGDTEVPETFYLLTEAGDNIVSEDDNKILLENG